MGMIEKAGLRHRGKEKGDPAGLQHALLTEILEQAIVSIQSPPLQTLINCINYNQNQNPFYQ